MIKPRGFDLWNPAMRGVYAKGWAAAEAGQTLADCPYQDKRKDCGRLTWSRAFIACWCDGFEAYKQHLITSYYQDTRRATSTPQPVEQTPVSH